MIQLTVRIDNLDRLRANFAKAPGLALRYLSQATRAAIFEIEKQAVDDNFRFKTPRAFRTGYLALSFAYGRHFDRSGLRGAIGPTAHYAWYVWAGTRRMSANPFMERIAGAAETDVNRHFEKAVDLFVSDLARV